jgi:hypothetical protein
VSNNGTLFHDLDFLGYHMGKFDTQHLMFRQGGRLIAILPAAVVVEPKYDEKNERYLLVIRRTRHGNLHQTALDADFIQSGDYEQIKELFRPGHGDYTYFRKYGIRDYRGGGRASSRETASRVAAGAIAAKVIARAGMEVVAYARTLGGIEIKYGWEDFLKNGGDFDKVIYREKESTLYVCPVSPNVVLTHHVFDSPTIVDLWSRLKEQFDLVIVDSPPATTSPDGIAISRHVDGVVLVLEAEKTRWPVAIKAKETIEKHGGKLLGVVFNKRQYYIPEFIYKRL